MKISVTNKKRKKHTVLTEVTEKEIEQISDFVTDVDPEKLAFGNLFGDKMRVLLKSDISDNNSVNTLFKIFKKNGYFVDFIGGKAEKTIRTQRGLAKRSMKIGKILNRASELIGSLNDIDPGGTSGERYRLHDKLKELFPKISGDDSREILGLKDFWESDSEKYRKEPDTLSSNKNFVIISRHPIDIVRMADFDELETCHSPPSRADHSFFKCALAEARGMGAVAYLMGAEELFELTGASDSLEELQSSLQDYDNDEIFRDESRGVKGIEPKARVRIRRFDRFDEDENLSFSLAVPEVKVYPYTHGILGDKVADWTRSKQKDLIDWLKNTKHGHDTLYLRGGSYSDSPAGELVEDFVGADLHKFKIKHYEKDEDDLISPHNLSEERVREVVDEVNGRLRRIRINATISLRANHPDINVKAKAYFDFEASEFIKPLSKDVPQDWPGFGELAELLEEYSLGADSYAEDIDRYAFGGQGGGQNRLYDTREFSGAKILDYTPVGGGTEKISIALPLVVDGEYLNTMEEFEELAVSFYDKDLEIEKHTPIIREWLLREGFLRGSAMKNLESELGSIGMFDLDWDHAIEEGEFGEPPYRISFENITHIKTPNPEYAGKFIEVVTDEGYQYDATINIKKAIVNKVYDNNNVLPGERYYPNFDLSAMAYKTDPAAVEVKITMSVPDDAPESLIKYILEMAQTWDDEDIENLILTSVQESMYQYVEARQVRENFNRFDKFFKRR